MKKFLSLVLALVMTMSLVTISAGAKDFTDADKVTYTEAVDVISAVKVVDGYADGSFNPTATLTRGAAAKIICNLILGPTTASALKADAAPYKDVPVDSTFAGYIAYCAKEGIISGYADGTFKPGNTLTSYAFMKMLLGALGYDADVEGYTGANWSINVAKRALNIGLDDGLVEEFNGIKAVTREEACLYALNTLKANMVDYASKTTVSVGDAEVVIAGSKAQDVKNDADKETIKDDDVMQFAEKYFTNLKLNAAARDDFARPANQWKVKAEEIGTYTKTPDLTYTKAVKSGDIYKDLGLSNTISKTDVTVYVNGVEDEDCALSIKKGDESKVGAAAGTNANGVLTEVFYNDKEDTVEITQIVTYVGQISKTVAATAKKDTYVVIDLLPMDGNKNPMSTPKGVSASQEFETEVKFEDDEYVLYTYSASAEEVKSVASAEKLSGYVSKTINKVSDTDQNNGLTVDGTDYKMSCAATGEALGNVSVKNDYTVILDEYGYVIYVEEIEEIGDYALVLKTAEKSDFVGNKAELLFTDGSTKVVSTAKNYNSGTNAIADNTIVTYKADDDGVYTLKAVSSNGGTKHSASTMTLKNDKAGIVVDGTTVNANSATVLVVRDVSDTDTWTAYTGIKNAPSIATAAAPVAPADKVAAHYFCKNGKMVTVMFIVPGANIDVEDDNNNMIYLSGESVSKLTHDADGDYFEFEAIVNGEIKTVKVDEFAKVGTTIQKDANGVSTVNKLDGLYKSFTTDKHGIITGLKTYDPYTDGKDKQYLIGTGLDKVSKEYTVILGAAKETITVDDNAKIYYVDKDGKISESAYKSLAKDDNDKVYAIVQDYLVKTLVVLEVPASDVKYGLDITAANATVKIGTKDYAGKTFEAEKNDIVTFTVAPADGYKVTGVEIDGVAQTVAATYTVKVTKLHTVKITTAEIAPVGEVAYLTLSGDMLDARVFNENGTDEYTDYTENSRFGTVLSRTYEIPVETAPVAAFALREADLTVAVVINGIAFPVDLTAGEEVELDDKIALFKEAGLITDTIIVTEGEDKALTLEYKKGDKAPSDEQIIANVVKALAEKDVTIVDVSVDKDGKYTFVADDEAKYTLAANKVTEAEMVTIYLDGKPVMTVKKGETVNVPGATEKKYIYNNKKVSDTMDDLKGISADKDRYLYTAFTVTVPASDIAEVKVVDGETKLDVTSDAKYVAKDAELTVTVKAGKTVKIGDEVVTAGETAKEVTHTVTGNVVIVASETATDFQKTLDDAVKAVKEAGASATNKVVVAGDGKSATITITNTSATGTGLLVEAGKMLTKGYKITVKSAFGKVEMDKDTTVDGSLKTTLLGVLNKTKGLSTDVTVTVTGIGDADPAVYALSVLWNVAAE